jgi:hypothetical protein
MPGSWKICATRKGIGPEETPRLRLALVPTAWDQSAPTDTVESLFANPERLKEMERLCREDHAKRGTPFATRRAKHAADASWGTAKTTTRLCLPLARIALRASAGCFRPRAREPVLLSASANKFRRLATDAEARGRLQGRASSSPSEKSWLLRLSAPDNGL